MRADERLRAAVIGELRYAIEEAHDQEVLVVGRQDDDGLIGDMVVAARGNEEAVPALMPYMSSGDLVIHNHPSGVLRPSSADLSVASRLGATGIGFAIVDNAVEEIYVVSEPVVSEEVRPLDVDSLAEMLEPGGKLSRIMPEYEPREAQIELLRLVTRSFNEDTVCVAEAGTGVGKSLAYLIPTLAWAATNGERVVVSTATINLQQQLLDKDIPLVNRLLPDRVKTVLVKGRRNYLCLHRLQEADTEPELLDGDSDGLAAIREWARNTKTGSKDDLAFLPPEGLWGQVCSEADTCLGLRCSHREGCFVIRARREAAGAQVLVANHHLLFSDLSIRMQGVGLDATAVLPPFSRIVLDEAHNTEPNATSYFSESLTRFSVSRQAGRLLTRRRGRSRGLLVRLERAKEPGAVFQRAAEDVEALRQYAEVLNSQVLAYLDGRSSVRLAGSPDEELDRLVLKPVFELQRLVLGLVETVEQILHLFSEDDAESDPVFETRSVLRRLQAFAAFCEQFRSYDGRADSIVWIERGRSARGEPYARLVITPLEIAPILREALFEPYKTVVCTSATLAIRDSFGFFRTRVGLTSDEDREVLTGIFTSPFLYKERVLLGVPTTAPTPERPDYQEFVSRFVSELLAVSEGKGLVLFTSYDMLTKTYTAVKPALEQLGITVFRQGDDDRSRLLVRFREDTASVLFATASFWEGVDTPGESLQVVVICRLPFRVPTEPIIQARVEAVQRRGGNAFAELSLPEAVMRLKQGFGRLMRRGSDRGVVVILDPRVVRKSYGRIFLESLPQTLRSVKEPEEVLRDVESFLYEE